LHTDNETNNETRNKINNKNGINKKVDMKKFLTQSETEREMRYVRVCSRFQELQEQYPQYTRYRLMRAISFEENLTVAGIRRILVNNNAYHLDPKKQKS
jgi:hypothetical protein